MLSYFVWVFCSNCFLTGQRLIVRFPTTPGSSSPMPLPVSVCLSVCKRRVLRNKHRSVGHSPAGDAGRMREHHVTALVARHGDGAGWNAAIID